MQFRQGMLGVAVLAVAIAGALIGSWVMSMDVEEREVIKYAPLTDITGLFDTEMAPQFTDYSPSTNYTGYWTTASVEGEIRYFDGVDFTQASRANNYRVNLPPVVSTQGTVNLPADSPSDQISQLWVWSYRNGSTGYTFSDSIESIQMSDVIELVTEQTSGTFRIASHDNADVVLQQTTPDLEADWLIIANKADFRSNDRYDVMTMDYREHAVGPATSQHMLALSCIVDLDKRIATLFYDNNYQTRIADVSLDQCVVIYGGDDGATADVILGDSGAYKFELFPPQTYMDPTKGVEME